MASIALGIVGEVVLKLVALQTIGNTWYDDLHAWRISRGLVAAGAVELWVVEVYLMIETRDLRLWLRRCPVDLWLHVAIVALRAILLRNAEVLLAIATANAFVTGCAVWEKPLVFVVGEALRRGGCRPKASAHHPDCE